MPMTSRAAVVARIFSSLKVPNYRLYFVGQVVSLSGTWMQGVAQAWLVLDLTGSGTALGLVSSLQFLPVLLFGPLGGVIADRFDKRKILYATQISAALLAVTLGTLGAPEGVEVWMVFVIASLLGVGPGGGTPPRQTLPPRTG